VKTASCTKAAIGSRQPALSASIVAMPEEEDGTKGVPPIPEAVTFPPILDIQMTAQKVLGACNKVTAELRAIVADRSKLVG
jgi:hypothetical protein